MPTIQLVCRLLRWLPVVLWCAPGAGAAVHHVDDDNAERPDAAFAKIQPAIDSAAEGDEIVVWPGRYEENLRFEGKNLHLRSSRPSDLAVVTATVIDGARSGSVIRFRGTETTATVVEGFTLTGGLADRGGGIDGGATIAARATIRFNRIRRNIADEDGGGISNCAGRIEFNAIEFNVATRGGGLSQCNGSISNNEVAHNGAVEGGGLSLSAASIVRNQIHDNSALRIGGGLHRCSGPIEVNTVERNRSVDGGGLSTCSGTIRDNRIFGNTATRGGGLYDCKGTVENNVIQKNKANGAGGGLYNCNGTVRGNRIVANLAGQDGGAYALAKGATIEANTIEANVAGGHGGGLYQCEGTIRGNRIVDNRADLGGGLAACRALVEANRIERNTARLGGGLWRCEGELRNNLVQVNRAERGAGFDRCRGTIQNNTLAFNLGAGAEDTPSSSSLGAGMAFRELGAVVRNNLFYRNDGEPLAIDRLSGAPDRLLFANNLFFHPDHALLRDVSTGETFAAVAQLEAAFPAGGGNLQTDPLLTAPAGADADPLTVEDNDLRLSTASPAINAGSMLAMNRLPVRDLDGMARFVDLQADIGCFEFGGGPDADGDGLADAFESARAMNPQRTDSDDDGAADPFELMRGTDPTAFNVPLGQTVRADGEGIQAAILQAFNREKITIEPGRYREALTIGGKTLRLSGRQPADPAIVDQTVIDAGGVGSVILYDGGEGAGSAVEGLTLKRGRAFAGAAIRGNLAPVALRGCRVTDNLTNGDGTVSEIIGEIVGNRFDDNLTTRGGALSDCPGDVLDNSFIDNRAVLEGGALDGCSGRIAGNRFEGNSANEGGALFRANGTVEDNLFTGNFAAIGGAISRANNEIRNNVFLANNGFNGGALSGCQGVVADNTFTSNTARLGGAIDISRAKILRNRFVDNFANFGGGALINCEGAVEENRFENNFGFSGGALAVCTGAIRRNTFIRNRCLNNGGALALCTGEIEGNRVLDNVGRFGGGLFDCDGWVHDNTIAGNTAADLGGGMHGCDGRIERNLIERNHAVDGGGIWTPRGTIVNNRIQGNTAEFRGGGIMSCHGTLFGNLIQGNVARFGGAVQTGGGNVYYNTFVGNGVTNGGLGGGLHNVAGAVENNIFWANSGYAIYNSEERFRPPSVRNNDFWQNWDGHYLHLFWNVHATVEQLDAEVPEAEGNFELEPRFIDPTGRDFTLDTFDDNDLRLRPDSPLIDIGLAMEPPAATDVAGIPRPAAGFSGGPPKLDLGAYEHFGVIVTAPAKPLSLRAGETFEVEWFSNPLEAGTGMRFDLYWGNLRAAFLGHGWDPTGHGKTTLNLPGSLIEGVAYRVRATSEWDTSYWGEAPGAVTATRGANEPAGLTGRNAVERWREYR
jgi:hypothetical protein